MAKPAAGLKLHSPALVIARREERSSTHLAARERLEAGEITGRATGVRWNESSAAPLNDACLCPLPAAR